MSSLKQIEANRRNALKSTGPTTQEGKERSRCNALRHGLSAETIISRAGERGGLPGLRSRRDCRL